MQTRNIHREQWENQLRATTKPELIWRARKWINITTSIA